MPSYKAVAEDACRKVLASRIKTCTNNCIAKAKAAVDPDVRDRILGYGCQTNCAKLEMFNGHVLVRVARSDVGRSPPNREAEIPTRVRPRDGWNGTSR